VEARGLTKEQASARHAVPIHNCWDRQASGLCRTRVVSDLLCRRPRKLPWAEDDPTRTSTSGRHQPTRSRVSARSTSRKSLDHERSVAGAALDDLSKEHDRGPRTAALDHGAHDEETAATLDTPTSCAS